ncbi:hypothetical protein CTEN210_00385 [Chaetoceros tenuissimus]|uniref:CRAL-TRIO domain-containing protein n=1 Tax=Chaetoceros tenuissimus TaxID=426638 RepID=A0AAD3CFL6_9STRA|nr:hypothetical protein CTEN210_00385 [Chaetoceros tenuissimus]
MTTTGSIKKRSTTSATISTTPFPVSNDEIDQMINAVADTKPHDPSWIKEAHHHLSRAWVRAVMGQPYKKDKTKRRPFDYSKKKLMDYLEWRQKTNITHKIAHHINQGDDNTEYQALNAGSKDCYWYGTDKEGSPVLWYRADATEFRKCNIANMKEYTYLVIQGAIDHMPDTLHSINFVILFDQFDLVGALGKPALAPNFIKGFMKICPDRLKRAYFVTGNIGHMFLKIANSIAPKSIMDKVVEYKSREAAARALVEDGVVCNEHHVPDFMGGESYVHDQKIVSNYAAMMTNISNDMRAMIKE